ncbi:MAG: sulfite exporter TauE/SafE family protein [Acidobacteriota bacterium]
MHVATIILSSAAMETHQIGLVAACGIVCSFFAGLMGIGGGVLMAPLLLLVPSLSHTAAFPVPLVAGLAVTQDLVGSFVAAVVHRRFKFQNRDLLIRMCSAIFVGALAGAVLSHYARGETILVTLAILVTLGAGCMLTLDLNVVDLVTDNVSGRNGVLTIVVAALVGVLAGFVGQGAGFLLLPAMLVILRLTLRVTVANSLGIIFCAALGGLLGRWGTQQVSASWLLVLLLTAIPGAIMGGYVSARITHKVLGHAMIALLVFASIQLWIKVLAI